jgi:hypothetical protein
MMQTQTNDQGANRRQVTRVLAVSPEQSELIRRNYSRIFVAPAGESMIDAVLFQGQRPVENFMEEIARAIAHVGMKVEGGDIQIRHSFDSKVMMGFFSQLAVTNEWLEDEKGNVYDLIVECAMVGERLTDPEGIESFDGNPIDEADFENPLCFKIGVENLDPLGWNTIAGETTPNLDNVKGQTQGQTQAQITPRPEPEVELRGGNTNGNRTPGRVTNPATDKRLKQNRDQVDRPEQLEVARRAQDGEDTGGSSTGRQPGRPGRVRYPELDGRLKQNRRQPETASQGR